MRLELPVNVTRVLCKLIWKSMTGRGGMWYVLLQREGFLLVSVELFIKRMIFTCKLLNGRQVDAGIWYG